MYLIILSYYNEDKSVHDIEVFGMHRTMEATDKALENYKKNFNFRNFLYSKKLRKQNGYEIYETYPNDDSVFDGDISNILPENLKMHDGNVSNDTNTCDESELDVKDNITNEDTEPNVIGNKTVDGYKFSFFIKNYHGCVKEIFFLPI